MLCGHWCPEIRAGFDSPDKHSSLATATATATGSRKIGMKMAMSPYLPQQRTFGSIQHWKMTNGASRRLSPAAFEIDRRYHMERAWERQDEAMKRLESVESDILEPKILKVSDLRHLEAVLDAVGGRLVVLYLHSRSCGVCKELRRGYVEVCEGSHRQKDGIVFLEHDIFDEFDFLSDVARFYRTKAVPRFILFVDGAVKRSVGLPDLRGFPTRGGRAGVANLLHGEQQKLKATLWELLVKNAPSARR